MIMLIVCIVVVLLVASGFLVTPVRNWILTRGAGVTSDRRRRDGQR